MAPGLGIDLRFTRHSSQGDRKYMEDMLTVEYHVTEDGKDVEVAYFAVFDGHGGSEAASFAKEHLLNKIVAQKEFWTDDDDQIIKSIRKGFLDTQEGMWNDLENWPRKASGLESTSGTTATIGFIKKGKLYIGHVGDSGIALGYKVEGEDGWKAQLLTKDHKPEDELENTRIVNSGGKVIKHAGVPRVVWNRPRIGHSGPVRRSTHFDEIPFLAVARSLGDLWSFNAISNTYIVSPEPDTHVLKLDVSQHKCLIFGTDGLWNVITPSAAVAVIQVTEFRNSSHPKGDEERVWINPSQKLVSLAIQTYAENRLRADNTSVITLILDPPGPPRHDVRSECPVSSQALPTVSAMLSAETAESQKNCIRDLMPQHLATRAELVGPPPAAVSFKWEPLWDLAYERNGVTGPAAPDNTHSEESSDHKVRVIDAISCDPENLPLHDDSLRSLGNIKDNTLPVTLHNMHIGNGGNEHPDILEQGFTVNPTCRNIKTRQSTAGSPYQKPHNHMGTARGWDHPRHRRRRTLSENNPCLSQEDISSSLENGGNEHPDILEQGFTVNRNNRNVKTRQSAAGIPCQKPHDDMGTALGWDHPRHRRRRTRSENNPCLSQEDISSRLVCTKNSVGKQFSKKAKGRNLSGGQTLHSQSEFKRPISKSSRSKSKNQSSLQDQAKETTEEECLPCLEEQQGRVLQTVTAAVCEDALPIAKKLRSRDGTLPTNSQVAVRLAKQNSLVRQKSLKSWRKLNNPRRHTQ